MAQQGAQASRLRDVGNCRDARAADRPAKAAGEGGRGRLAAIAESPAGPVPTRDTCAAEGKENAADEAGVGAASLRAKIDVLRRESEMRAGRVPQTDGAGDREVPMSLQAVVNDLVADPDFHTRVQSILHAQLTSTKDGATKEGRIRELADMVKQCRKVLREAMGRMEQLGGAARQFETAAAQALERAQRTDTAPGLSERISETQAAAQIKMLQAEVLEARTAFKNLQAQAQVQSDRLTGQLSGAMREVDRHRQEKELAEQFQRRAEEKAAKVESEVRQMKRECRDQVRAAEAEVDALQKQLAEAQRSHQAERDQLAARLGEAERRLAEAETRVAALGRDLADTTRAKAALEKEAAQLKGANGGHQALIARLEGDAAALWTQLESAQRGWAAAEAALGVARAEAAEWRGRAERAEREGAEVAERLGAERDSAEAARARAAAEAAAAVEEARGLRREVAGLQGELRETRTAKDRLKEGLQEASEQLTALGEQLAQAGRTEAELRASLASAEEAAASEGEGRRAAESRAERAEAEAAEAVGELEATKRRARDAETKLEAIECELETLKDIAGGGGDQKDLLNRLIAKVGQLEAAAAENEARRRALQNEVLQLKGNVRVFCRVRPGKAGPTAVQCLPDRASVAVAQGGKDHAFSFDRVFPPTAGQAEVFAEVAELVQSALDGYQVCLFSYGQTGAGKTHTMQGQPGSPSARGVIPRAVDLILDSAARMERQGWRFAFEAAFVEIYNEQIRDLLACRRGGSKIDDKNPIKHDPDTGVAVVQGAVREAISCCEDAHDMIRRANAARATESTAMNAESSRSHSVFMMYITGTRETTQTRLTGALNLVDLAGSERLDRSLAEGARAKEAIQINKSLSALGDVFAALSAKQTHVPYRNSKLTHLLQPCLGGDGKTLMFVNISPEPDSAHETVCSLRFAARVNQCETAARGGARRTVTVAGEEPEGAKAPRARPTTAPATRAKRARV